MGRAIVEFKGGKKLSGFFEEAGKGGVKALDVGFFETAKYFEGTSVSLVAVANEFGIRGLAGNENIPERPFFRNANKSNERVLLKIIKNEIDPKTLVVDRTLATRLGLSHQAAVQRSIVDLRTPPNSPRTLKRKYPQTNPLIHSGMMARSITFKVQL